ncbi:MAG TPA: alcohol acetyltransferase [Candidatus Agrococcus pullicola]|uniref:Alcohol acetyltransferase n=1 Tax=Candidatus Agrococcus pullicola TaxID=2838429 RepID=A0A9D2C9F3_9MICO|nr:alcohol acetyltransferase [Candidatus Agrococcus pullicola]
MTRRAWVRLDNASNIFLAARSDADSKVFRMSAELDHDVDAQLLQEALDEVYDHYPLYHAVLRRGVFWHYLQDSDLRPTATPDDQHTCAPIYLPDRRNLLFRVAHHRTRIVLEVFHALSDGTGALWFLSDLLNAYTRRSSTLPGTAAVPDTPGSAHPPGTIAPRSDAAAPRHELTADSFAQYFRGKTEGVGAQDSDFSKAAATPVLEVEDEVDSGKPLRRRPGLRPSFMDVYHPKGTRTPDNRTRAVELTLPSKDLLDLAKAIEVSPTMYLTALFFESIRRSSGGLGKKRTLSASIPVNLRQFFPSDSARNFFATVTVRHTYGEGLDDIAAIAKQLDGQFRPKATPEALERKLRKLIRAERMVVLRVFPRPIKDMLLRLINWGINRGISVAVSNLGRVTLPEPAESHVERMLFHVSAVRPQFCAVSHAGYLTISFTSPFTEIGHVREFARMLTENDIPVTVAAAKVTEQELMEQKS